MQTINLYDKFLNEWSTEWFQHRQTYIKKRFQEWFKRSELKQELMANVWHPRNFEKFKYLDPETFGEEF